LRFCICGGVALLGESYGLAPQRLLGDLYGLATAVFFGCYDAGGAAARARHGAAALMFCLDGDHGRLPVRHRVRVRAGHPAAIDRMGADALLALAIIVSQVGGQGLVAVALGTLPRRSRRW
jgi:hypothetical protein